MWKKGAYIGKVIVLLALLFETAYTKGKEPICAGTYYPSSAPLLQREVDRLLEEAFTVPFFGRVIGIITPHAGYRYSGAVAACAYKIVQRQIPKCFIIIAPSHRLYFEGVSVYTEDFYVTPIGKVQVDRERVLKLTKVDPLIRYVPEAHKFEHSIEVQLPFIQRITEGAKIVPLLMGEQSKRTCKLLADALLKIISDDTVIVATTDLSHYRPWRRAKSIDKKTIECIKEGEVSKLFAKLQRGEVEMCGSGPVAVLLLISRKVGAQTPLLLSYSTSFDATKEGEHEVVGYASFFVHKRKLLSKKAQKKLLQIARNSIEAVVLKKPLLLPKKLEEELLLQRGVFVTLKKGGKLRGCVGFVKGVAPLHEAVSAAAIKAATEDIRFEPLKVEELQKVRIQISVLSELSQIFDPSLIEPGVHGVYVVKGWRAGILLPQVARQLSLRREAFLSLCCRKAGLSEDAWRKSKDLKIYIFVAQVFGE